MLIGESCIDEYHYGECNRISPEAPIPIFDFSYKIEKYGMASNVKQNLESFGCSVDFITNDPKHLIKRRFVDIKSNHQIFREDFGNTVHTATLMDMNKNYDIVIISDYNKNFIDNNLITMVCNKYKNIFVDTKKKNLSSFSNCFIKINQEESKNIIKYGNNCNYIITKGKDGAEYNGKIYKAPQVEIHDVTGAGDVFLAVLSILYTVTNNIEESIEKSIKLATISVGYNGIYKITEKNIHEICD